MKLPSRSAVRWTGVAALLLAGAASAALWSVFRAERHAYDGLVTTVMVGCEADEIRWVGVEVYHWKTDRHPACARVLTRADVAAAGDDIQVTLFERCRRGDDPPNLAGPGALPRHTFAVPVRWQRPGPTRYVNEFAEGRLTQPRSIKLARSCMPAAARASGPAP